jgi:hypothetical protein
MCIEADFMQGLIEPKSETHHRPLLHRGIAGVRLMGLPPRHLNLRDCLQLRLFAGFIIVVHI